jgi:acetyl-CoA C-acetyltransferase
MTLFRRRLLETPRELLYHATRGALDSAGLELKDVEAVVLGSAPDAFDGVHMKGEYLAEGAGVFNKPHQRVYVGGATGVFVPIAAWWHVASGMFDVVLAAAEEKMSPLHPHPQYAFWSIFDWALERPLGVNLLWIFSLQMTEYMSRYGVRDEDIALVSVKNKGNALLHPSAQAAAKISVEDVMQSETIVWPVRRLMVSPTSDGAAAVVLASESVARRLTDDPVWIAGVGWNVDSQYWTDRELAYQPHTRRAADMAFRMAGIDRPRKQLSFVEPYDPFAHLELVNLESMGIFGKGESVRALKEGVLDRDGELPSTPSGGLLGVGNPIAAAGMMKVVECYLQLSGKAGRRQLRSNLEAAACQAWGDLLQASTVMVLTR